MRYEYARALAQHTTQYCYVIASQRSCLAVNRHLHPSVLHNRVIIWSCSISWSLVIACGVETRQALLCFINGLPCGKHQSAHLKDEERVLANSVTTNISPFFVPPTLLTLQHRLACQHKRQTVLQHSLCHRGRRVYQAECCRIMQGSQLFRAHPSPRTDGGRLGILLRGPPPRHKNCFTSTYVIIVRFYDGESEISLDKTKGPASKIVKFEALRNGALCGAVRTCLSF